MRKNKLLLLLVLLMTAATGAWADETLLLTIESRDYKTFKSGSKTFDDKVTVTFSNTVKNDGDNWGWYANSSESLLTVAGINGYTITSCKFYVEVDGIAMTGYTIKGESPSVYLSNLKVYTDNSQSVKIGANGVTKIEVYEAAASDASASSGPAVAWDKAEKTGTFTMPGGNVTLEPEYYPQAALTAAPTAINDVPATTDGAIVKAGTVATIGSTETAQGTVMYYVSQTALDDAALLALAADKWTVKVGDGEAQALPIGGLKGDGTETVTLKYNGRLKVKGVKATSDAGAPAANIVDLSKLTENTELKDGDVLTGTLGANVKISIADGATVTLDGVTINGVNDMNYSWAGITCLGDATIILSGTNTVNGFYQDYPGIQAAAGKTLIINGTGSLTASSYGKGAGIGGVNNVACGNIEIQDGTITATSLKYGAGIGGGDRADCGNITISGGIVTATGGERGAGIGGGRRGPTSGSCGNIIISGGTVTATGGENAAGIGGGRGYNSGNLSSCGTITITTGVTKVTATMGSGATYSIGAGKYGTCGTVTIGGNVGAITTSPYTYQPE